MILNYFKIARRTLLNQWQYSLINIVGLASGMVCCIFILLYVRDERSYDRFHRDAGRIYRMTRESVNNTGQREPEATTAFAMAYSLRKDLPEIEAAATLIPSRQLLVQSGSTVFYEDKVFASDSNLFNVFSFPFLKGNAKEALATSQSIVLTESTARRYFGNQEPSGKMIHIENQGDYFVTGVLKDVPTNSHFRFDMLILVLPWGEDERYTWGQNHCYTYIKLRPHTDPAAVQARLQPLAKKYRPQTMDAYSMQALVDIHLNSKLKDELEPNGDESTLQILSAIGLFVIIIASINYINMSTARSAKRAKEVGIRKTSGAFRTSLIGQFLTESVMMSILAFLVSILLIFLLDSPFNSISAKQLDLTSLAVFPVWSSLTAVAVAIGLVAGLYPALYLSSFNPVNVLKGVQRAQNTWLRKGLVSLQFTISITLIIGTLVIIRQMNYIRSSRLGFDKEQVIVLPNVYELAGREVLEQQLAQLPGVIKVGASTSGLDKTYWSGNARTDYSQGEKMIDFCQINYDFLDAMGIQLIDGRNFSRLSRADTINTVILNETAVRELNLTHPVGKRLIWESTPDRFISTEVIGVVSDFHYSSFHEPIKPYAFLIRNSFFVQYDFTTKLFIKTKSDDQPSILKAVETTWKQFVPQRPFTYYYLDDIFNSLHKTDERFKVLFSWLTGLAIFIACLGLFALIAFVVEQRTKEIGIRKVLGASATHIAILIYKDFLMLMVIALMIASPVAWYFMNGWLEGFAYHIEIGWWVFATAGILSFLIAFVTISYQSIKASLMNPVNSLKME